MLLISDCSFVFPLPLPRDLQQETRNYPESYPQLPRDETVENPHLQKHILELASMLDVRNVFLETTLDDY